MELIDKYYTSDICTKKMDKEVEELDPQQISKKTGEVGYTDEELMRKLVPSDTKLKIV